MAKILIVDDSIIMRKNLEYILKQEGHEVVGQAINGKQVQKKVFNDLYLGQLFLLVL